MKGRGIMTKLLFILVIFIMLICSSLILYRFFPRADKCYIKNKYKEEDY